MWYAIRPLDRQHAALKFFKSKLVGRGLLEAIQISVIEREASASVFVHKGERRAADFPRVDAQARRQAPNEGRLPCSQIARQEKDVARRESRGEIAGNARGLRF